MFTRINPTDMVLDYGRVIPDVLPVSMRDVYMSDPLEMNLFMSDPCPNCGAFRMMVGDYVCWGICYICFSKMVGDEDE